MNKPPFKPHQIAKDTERAMMGRPQIHGAAEPEEDSVVPPKGPEPAPAPATPPSPDAAPPEQKQDQGAVIAQLQSELAQCHSRIEALEAKVGMNKPEDQADDDQKPPMGPGVSADYDEEYE